MRSARIWVKVALVCTASFSLGGCLILPGEFVSDMTVHKNGEFSFSYKGQIQLVGLANILNSEALNKTASDEFKATCWNESSEPSSEISEEADTDQRPDDIAVMPGNTHLAMMASLTPVVQFVAAGDATPALETGEDARSVADDAAELANAAAQTTSSWPTERECSKAEVAEQKAAWDLEQAAAKQRDEEAKKMASMMLGGIDPRDPKTIARFTREVERLAAWHKVEHMGNGVFMIDYSTKGKLADDFAFPVIPRYALGEPMIHVTRWDNGRLRVEAPAFKTDKDLSMMSLLSAGSLLGMMGASDNAKKPAEPVTIKGIFTLSTDAPIIANNTEEGPESSGTMEILRWDIGPANYGAPMALLKLAR